MTVYHRATSKRVIVLRERESEMKMRKCKIHCQNLSKHKVNKWTTVT